MKKYDSNFVRDSHTGVDGYQRVPYPGYEGFECSRAGKIRSRKTLYVLSPFRPMPKNPELYVSLDPTPGSGFKRKSIRVAKVIFETFSGIMLPGKTRIQHLNNDPTDNRYVNLAAPGFPKPEEKSAITSQNELPVVRVPYIPGVIANGSSSKPLPSPSLSATEKRAIERYKRELASATELVLCSEAMVTLADIKALDLDDLMLLDIMENIQKEQLAAFILKVIQLSGQ
jgi:hypothetical protein